MNGNDRMEVVGSLTEFSVGIDPLAHPLRQTTASYSNLRCNSNSGRSCSSS